MNPDYQYRATVDRVVDGDSIYLWIDCGFYLWTRLLIRLAEINAPELRGQKASPEGKVSRDYLEGLLPKGTKVILQSKKTGKFGRWIGVITLEGNDVSVNQMMLDAGHAQPYK